MGKWDQHGEKFLELRSQGQSYRRIADQMPVSVTTLKSWGKKFNADLVKLSLGRVEAFVEANLLDVQSRLALRAEQIQRMRLELAARDFTQVDTAALIRHYIKYVDSVQKDVEPVRVEFTSTMESYEQIILKCGRLVDEDESDAPGELSEASDS